MPALRILRRISLAAICLASPTWAAPPTIADLAPQSALMVAGVDDFSAFRASFDRSPYGALWADPEMRAYAGAMLLDLFAPQRSMLTDLGIDWETFRPPAGSTGVAVFLAPDAADKKQQGFFTGMHAVAFADFRDATADADAVWNALEKLADKVAKDGLGKRGEKDHAGAVISTLEIDFAEIDRRADADAARALEEFHAKRRAAGPADDDQGDMDADEPWSPPSDMARSGLPSTIYMTRVGGAVAASTSLATLEDAIDRFRDEPARSPSVGDSPTFVAALAQHGKAHLTPGAFYAVGLFDKGEWLLSRFLAADIAPEFAAANEKDTSEFSRAIFAGLGLDQAKAFSVVNRFDTPDAAAETNFALLVPEKRGLFSLLDTPPTTLRPPPVVPADASSMYLLNMKFAQIPALARSVIAGLPQQERDQAEGFLGFVLPQAEPLLNAMGSEMAIVTRIERPFTRSSSQTAVAIRLADQQRFIAALAPLTAMLGMAPRDFLGNQVWSSDAADTAIGVGGGHVVIGLRSGVEGALREISEPARARLNDEPGFVAARRTLAGEGQGLYFNRYRDEIEYAAWRVKNYERILTEQMEEYGGDPAENRRFVEQMVAAMPPWSKEPLPADALLRAFGDSIGDLRSTPEGFVTRLVTLRPAR